MGAVKLFSTTQAKYDALAEKNNDALYFVEDTRTIYKGAVDMTSSTYLMDTVPTALTPGRIAVVKQTTDDVTFYQFYVGNADGTVTKVLPGTTNDKSTFAETDKFGVLLPTISAVKGYVDDSVKTVNDTAKKAVTGASYDKATGSLTLTQADGSNIPVSLNGVAHDATYDAATMTLTIPSYGGKDIVVNIPKDKFLQTGEYVASYTFNAGQDDEYKAPAIVLTINAEGGAADANKTIAIPVGSLVDTYTVADTDTVDLNMDVNHNITASVKFDTSTLDGTETVLVKTAKGMQASDKTLSGVVTEATTTAAADATAKADKALADSKTYVDNALTWKTV